jgi:hypothetical protein
MLDEKFDPVAYKGIAPGTRVMVFDHLLYKDDRATPLSVTVKPATVLCHYGEPERRYGEDLTLGPYESLVDVLFDHRPERPSKGHFTWGIELIGGPSIRTKIAA